MSNSQQQTKNKMKQNDVDHKNDKFTFSLIQMISIFFLCGLFVTFDLAFECKTNMTEANLSAHYF